MSKILSSKGAWNIGILVVRLMVAIFIFRYGRELFHIKDLLQFLTDIKWPFPVFSGYAAKIIELVGAVLLALGLFTRIASVLLMIVMAGVVYTMNKGNIFDGEHATLFFLLFAFFCFAGPGKYSLDYLLFDRGMPATLSGSRAMDL